MDGCLMFYAQSTTEVILASERNQWLVTILVFNSWGTQNAEIKVPMVGAQGYHMAPQSQPGVGQNILYMLRVLARLPVPGFRAGLHDSVPNRHQLDSVSVNFLRICSERFLLFVCFSVVFFPLFPPLFFCVVVFFDGTGLFLSVFFLSFLFGVGGWEGEEDPQTWSGMR